MIVLKDRLALGTIAGITGGIVSFCAQYPLYRIGWSLSTWPQRATGATVSKAYYNSTGARPLGMLTMIGISALFGIAQTYIYSVTGKDYRLLKASGFGVMSWLGVHGLGSRLTYSFDPKDSSPKTSGLSLFTNFVHALVTSEMINKLGDKSLFTCSGLDEYNKEEEPSQTPPY